MAMIDSVTELTLEGAGDLIQSLAKNMDENRYSIGRIGLAIATQYGNNSRGELAKHAGLKKRSLYEYISVVKFYGDMLDDIREWENVSYTHVRDAMRLGDNEAAYDWLLEVSNNGYTVDEASVKLKERLGKDIDKWVLVGKYGGHVYDDLPDGGVLIVVRGDYVDTIPRSTSKLQIRIYEEYRDES